MRNFFLVALLLLISSCGGRKDTIIAYDADWYADDFGFYDSHINGLTEDLLMEFSKFSGKSFEKINVATENLFDGLQRKKYQAVLATLYPYNFEEAKYDFSDIYLETGPIVVVSKNAKIQSIKEWKKELIGLKQNDPAVVFIEKRSDLIIKFYANDIDLLTALEKGDIDGAILGNVNAVRYLSDTFYGKFKILPTPLQKQGIRMIVLEGEEKNLLRSFNAMLKKMKKRKAYQKLLAKWSLSLK